MDGDNDDDVVLGMIEYLYLTVSSVSFDECLFPILWKSCWSMHLLSLKRT